MNTKFTYFFRGAVATFILSVMVAPFITKYILYDLLNNPFESFKQQVAPSLPFYFISMIIGAGIAVSYAILFLFPKNKKQPPFVEPAKEPFPSMKPRLLPMDSKVLTTFGIGYIKTPTKLGYHNVKITVPNEGQQRGYLQIEDKDLIKILETGKM